jgi:glucose-6-phosphate isomerase
MSEHVSDSAEWQVLQGHAEKFSAVHLRDLFGSDPGRGERLTAKVADLTVDYSKNLVTDEVLTGLLALAERAKLRERTAAMFAGEHINITEDRAVLHTALRLPRTAKLVVDGQDVVRDVHEVLDRMGAFSDRVG